MTAIEALPAVVEQLQREMAELREAAQVAERDAQLWRERATTAEAKLADAVEHAKRAKTKLGELRELLNDFNDSPAASQEVAPPPATPAEPAGGISQNSHEEPEPRDQVAGVEGSTMREGPASAPEQDREDGAQRLAGGASPGEGATASPAAARWARPRDEGQAWHAWPPAPEAIHPLCGDGEAHAPCYDDLLAEGVRPRAVEACVDCATLTGWDAPEKMSRDVQPSLTCVGPNKSAGVVCGSPRVAVVRDGKPYCKRHDPERRNNGRAEASGA